MAYPVIHLHVLARPKPAPGAACNGCGVCCTLAPCPLGVLASGHFRGACSALQWQADGRLYLCGLVNAPEALWPWLPRALLAPLQRLARRWIAAGAGCDCDYEAEPAERILRFDRPDQAMALPPATTPRR
jgi:hypothetical protein